MLLRLAFNEMAERGVTVRARHPMSEEPALPFKSLIVCRDQEQSFRSVVGAPDQQALAKPVADVSQLWMRQNTMPFINGSAGAEVVRAKGSYPYVRRKASSQPGV